ncbi:MAG: ABC transporter ATP-binding protein [Limnochordales bacterium]|nr:multidrug ABC transporter ATP-binding protein [Bacillota bacterium]
MNAIEVEHVVKRFGDVEALRGVSFTVREGEVFGLLGPNGAGKTTLIRTILGLVRPTEGRVRVRGEEIAKRPETVHRFVGWVPQERAMDPYLTGRENLLFIAGLHHIPPRQARSRVDELLALVELTDAADRTVRDYSGGMRRRLQLAMGLVHSPQILLLDEPSLGLDVQSRRRMWTYIEALRRSGTTVLVTTHYLDEADALCDRVAIIDRGQIQALDTTTALKQRFGGPALLVLEWDGAQRTDGLLEALQQLPGVRELEVRGAGVWVRGDDLVAVTQRVLAECERFGVVPARLSVRQPTLDDVFLALTGAVLRNGAKELSA